MALYVDIEPIVKRLTSVCVTDDCFGLGIQMGINHAMEIIAKAPIVEAEPVVHAHWEFTGVIGSYKCSACGFPDDSVDIRMRCSFCGAHMDEEVSDGT